MAALVPIQQPHPNPHTPPPASNRQGTDTRLYDLYDRTDLCIAVPCVSVSTRKPVLRALSLMRDACETLVYTLAESFIHDLTVYT